MKFGEKLRSEIVPEWSSLYLDYDKLKNMIKELEAYHIYDTQITDKGCNDRINLTSASDYCSKFYYLLIRHFFEHTSPNQ